MACPIAVSDFDTRAHKPSANAIRVSTAIAPKGDDSVLEIGVGWSEERAKKEAPVTTREMPTTSLDSTGSPKRALAKTTRTTMPPLAIG
ncbi:MAG: hypothetical protein C4318_05520 [Acidimicrobiia bacterium]